MKEIGNLQYAFISNPVGSTGAEVEAICLSEHQEVASLIRMQA